jgi:rRNA maturation RNase YbeY|tara:strand:- start:2852 stop:3274 length:423 start_codon:yes stop_codon:yes gene_type:complete
MSLDSISIETEYPEVLRVLDVVILQKVHLQLNLKKSVIYYIISDEELLAVNKSSLDHDYYTDIITFDYEDDEDIEDNEILVSWDRVNENAITEGKTSVNELYRVCFHGMLHLAGFDDQTPQQKTRMREQENLLLDKYCST